MNIPDALQMLLQGDQASSLTWGEPVVHRVLLHCKAEMKNILEIVQI